ncbi:MAG: hypothetical protein KDA61_14505, partial [Planctomycetales bacterium]|nr:hypothetical protein [Planctomycetales bacterium]
QRVQQIDELHDNAALPALCRVARFDPSPLVARDAALFAVALPDEESPSPSTTEPAATPRRQSPPSPTVRAAMQAEMGESDRAPVKWIRASLAEGVDPEQASALWRRVVDEEIALWRSEPSHSERAQVNRLVGRQLQWLARLGRTEAITDALVQWIEIDQTSESPKGRIRSLQAAFEWTFDHEQWEAFARLAGRYQSLCDHDRLLSYNLAEGYARQNRTDDAARAALHAFRLTLEDESERVDVGDKLAEMGQIEWAMREYRHVIDSNPLASLPGMLARSQMAMWLHDRLDYQGAADVMGELSAELANVDVLQRLVENLHEVNRSHESIHAYQARRYYYLACLLESQEKFAEQYDALQKAVEYYEEDADVLIALFHCKGADDAAKAQIRQRIRKVAAAWKVLIDEYPSIPQFYNQWAWLIANTEGDFKLAVQYSRNSLLLLPDEASYLDTLGRCYYAAGDLKNAVETQRRAVELQPQMQVMRRQLAQFEAELAEQEKQ